MRNRYPGICYRCGETVAVGEGTLKSTKPPAASGAPSTLIARSAGAASRRPRWPRQKPLGNRARGARLLRHDKLARSGTRHAVKNAATLSVDVLMVTVAPHAFIAA